MRGARGCYQVLERALHATGLDLQGGRQSCLGPHQWPGPPARRVAARARGRGGAASDARPGRAVLCLAVGAGRQARLIPLGGALPHVGDGRGRHRGRCDHVRARGSACDRVSVLSLSRSEEADAAAPPSRRSHGGRIVIRPGGGCWGGQCASGRAQALREAGRSCTTVRSALFAPSHGRVSARLLVQRQLHQTRWVLRKRGLRECLSRPQRVPLGMLPAAAAVVSCRQHGRAVRAKRARRLWRHPRFVA
mmetsp:Transcript_50016/g.167135  ORF Transcript_50016/g.167135 Transcript_50016/m.167135 type:complete len:249 (-) Transcript_50016:775-1521(-)